MSFRRELEWNTNVENFQKFFIQTSNFVLSVNYDWVSVMLFRVRVLKYGVALFWVIKFNNQFDITVKLLSVQDSFANRAIYSFFFVFFILKITINVEQMVFTLWSEFEGDRFWS